jgi:Predicted membrane protein
MGVVFLAVAVVVGLLSSWWYAPVAGWAAACLIYLVWVWAIVWRFGPEDTRSHATREDPNRATSDLLMLAASVASLAAVAIVLVRGHAEQGGARAGVAALAVASVALSWGLIHTLYMLRYARVYYTEPVGGIDYNQKEPPQYTDFAYLAFDLGMTYQVSDTSLQSTELRKIVFSHTLLSYMFGAVVLATTINLVVGLG